MKQAFLADTAKNLRHRHWGKLPFSAAVSALCRGLKTGQLSTPLWCTVATEEQADRMVELFRFWRQETSLQIYLYAQDDARSFDGASAPPTIARQRLIATQALYNKTKCVIVSSAFGALHQCVPQKLLHEQSIHLQVGNDYPRQQLREQLQKLGYLSTSLLDEPGLLIWRGESLTIWPVGYDSPLRLLFFDDELEVIQKLDEQALRVLEKPNQLVILPSREAIVTKQSLQRAKIHMATQRKNGRGTAQVERRVTENLEAGLWFPGAEDYLPALWPLENPLDYAAEHVIFAPQDVQQETKRWSELSTERWLRLDPTDHPLVDPLLRYTTLQEAVQSRKDPLQIDIDYPGDIQFNIQEGSIIRLKNSDLSDLIEILTTWIAEQWKIVIVCHSENRRAHIKALLASYPFTITHTSSLQECRVGQINLFLGALTEGFIDRHTQTAILSSQDLFYTAPRTSQRATKSLRKAALSSHTDLKIGDFVVHRIHGVGKFIRLNRLLVDGVDREVVELAYRDEAKLFIPLNKIDQLFRYRAAGSIQPRLDKLGGSTWLKRIKKVRDKTMAMAHELLRKYANRAARKGYEYKGQPTDLKQFSASFPYSETADQAASIEEVLADLASEKPMERLIVGDVGFGKTEVAMRAAMRVVLEGHQVAILCPTTVLALQHSRSFTQRFAPFAINIRLLTRLQSSAQAKDIKKQLAEGKVDILIGTHTLLSRTIRFKRLGLVVVDEEHRFGVRQKEKIKALSQENPEFPAAYLAMSATPIPRTLHMALSGLRDVSIIATPPHGRRSVRTMMLTHNPSKITQLIRRELQRGGQVFFVHNRIQSLAVQAHNLRQLIPEATIKTAHGQMSPRDIEKTMMDVINHKIHVLVCTSIIENGLDLPNVNTIIIDDAHKMGMAQLYQLRGRVGRGHQRGYCTFLIPETGIPKDALQRLHALQRFTDLGSGFAVASADLELRGSGNLLGKQQSGHIQAVGLDTYIQLLEEAVQALRKDKQRIDLEPDIKLPVAALLPEDYIPDTQERLIEYQKLATIDSIVETRELMDQWESRYGPLPQEAMHLGWLTELRLRCRRLGIERLHWLKNRVLLVLHSSTSLERKKLQELAKTYSNRISLITKNPKLWQISVVFLPQEAETPFHFLLWLFQRLDKCVGTQATQQ